MSDTYTPETHEFQAEVQQLLDLMIHSLYSNREIFLRELISNAADAADRLRFEALQTPALNEDDPEPRIEIRVDEKARTVSVIDNGTGMDRTEVIDHLGTIARSGTRRFLEAMTNDERQNAQLIGQFGVGFYSAFIVADKVTVHTRRAGLAPEDGVLWTSAGKGQFEIASLPREARGTEVTLYLAAEQDEFLDSFRLKSIVRRYSDHIAIPISIADEKGELETINQASALWMRPKAELSESDYHDFYRQLTFDTEPPLATLHNKVEGAQAYTSLLFLPSQAPFDLFEPEGRSGLRLYVRRVFIMEDREHRLMPRYLRFVRGIIDSDDLPLNVSRELLQHNRLIDRIRAASVKRVLDALERLAKDDADRYSSFWQAFGTVLKEGPVEDPANAEKIAGLLRFHSTQKTASPSVSLADYVSRMKPDQEAIYYLTGESFAAVSNSPHLEAFRKHELEVLLLAEPVDEWLTTHLTEFDGRPLKAITKGQLDLDQAESTEPPPESVSSLIERVKAALGDRVSDVRVSNRLTDSPACLVVDEGELGIHMQRMLKAAGHDLPSQQPILEINPEHAIIDRLAQMTDTAIDDWAVLLFEQSVLMEGGRLDDPASFVRRMNRLLD
ncbi:MAG: molecular chaperone HtpG [Gammaproteobacteria bacterium]|nr:molecular chaperone HtpG [Gammaproteobacteria bacterium]